MPEEPRIASPHCLVSSSAHSHMSTDDTTAASVALAVAAGGAIRSAKTTRLLNGQEWIESLRKAQGSQYRPAR